MEKCKICGERESKYRCPNCEIFYCSSNCFQSEKHFNCNEHFSKRCIEDALRLKRNDLRSLKHTVDILKRNHLLSDEHDDEENGLSRRINGLLNEINLEDEEELLKILDEMNLKEKFNEAIESEDIFNLLPETFWQPWYLHERFHLTFIEELHDEATTTNEQTIKHNDQINQMLAPEKAEQIAALRSLTSKPVSPLVKYSIINILLAYCYLMRIYNNEHARSPLEALDELKSVSPILNEQLSYCSNTNEAIQLTVQKLINEKKLSLLFIKRLLIDLKTIFNEKINFYEILLRMFSDLINLIKLTSKKMRKTDDKSFFQMKMKMKFFLAYLSEHLNNKKMFLDEINFIEIELIQLLNLIKSVENSSKQRKRTARGGGGGHAKSSEFKSPNNPFIEELD